MALPSEVVCFGVCDSYNLVMTVHYYRQASKLRMSRNSRRAVARQGVDECGIRSPFGLLSGVCLQHHDHRSLGTPDGICHMRLVNALLCSTAKYQYQNMFLRI
jgi:hypothetical protein